MSLSSIGVRTSDVTISQASVQWRNGSTGRIRTMEVELIIGAGTTQSVGFGVPAALAITPADVTFPRDDPADPTSLVISSISYATSPTAPTVYKRRTNTNNVVGVGIIWTFPRGQVMAISSAAVLFNITAASIADVNIVVDE